MLSILLAAQAYGREVVERIFKTGSSYSAFIPIRFSVSLSYLPSILCQVTLLRKLLTLQAYLQGGIRIGENASDPVVSKNCASENCRCL